MEVETRFTREIGLELGKYTQKGIEKGVWRVFRLWVIDNVLRVFQNQLWVIDNVLRVFQNKLWVIDSMLRVFRNKLRVIDSTLRVYQDKRWVIDSALRVFQYNGRVSIPGGGAGIAVVWMDVFEVRESNRQGRAIVYGVRENTCGERFDDFEPRNFQTSREYIYRENRRRSPGSDEIAFHGEGRPKWLSKRDNQRTWGSTIS